MCRRTTTISNKCSSIWTNKVELFFHFDQRKTDVLWDSKMTIFQSLFKRKNSLYWKKTSSMDLPMDWQRSISVDFLEKFQLNFCDENCSSILLRKSIWWRSVSEYDDITVTINVPIFKIEEEFDINETSI